MSLDARTRIATAVAAREVSDLARGAAITAGQDFAPGELIARMNATRIAQVAALDRAVLAERVAGASWELIADALGMPLADVVARYEPIANEWAERGRGGEVQLPAEHRGVRVGILNDTDLEGTAATVEAWIARHTELWDAPANVTLSARI